MIENQNTLIQLNNEQHQLNIVLVKRIFNDQVGVSLTIAGEVDLGIFSDCPALFSENIKSAVIKNKSIRLIKLCNLSPETTTLLLPALQNFHRKLKLDNLSPEAITTLTPVLQNFNELMLDNLSPEAIAALLSILHHAQNNVNKLIIYNLPRSTIMFICAGLQNNLGRPKIKFAYPNNIRQACKDRADTLNDKRKDEVQFQNKHGYHIEDKLIPKRYSGQNINIENALNVQKIFPAQENQISNAAHNSHGDIHPLPIQNQKADQYQSIDSNVICRNYNNHNFQKLEDFVQNLHREYNPMFFQNKAILDSMKGIAPSSKAVFK